MRTPPTPIAAPTTQGTRGFGPQGESVFKGFLEAAGPVVFGSVEIPFSCLVPKVSGLFLFPLVRIPGLGEKLLALHGKPLDAEIHVIGVARLNEAIVAEVDTERPLSVEVLSAPITRNPTELNSIL